MSTRQILTPEQKLAILRMEEVDIEVLVQAAREKFPGVTPRIQNETALSARILRL